MFMGNNYWILFIILIIILTDKGGCGCMQNNNCGCMQNNGCGCGCNG